MNLLPRLQVMNRCFIPQIVFVILTFLWISCSDDMSVVEENDMEVKTEMYFPPVDGASWETESLDALDWNEAEVDNLYEYLEQNRTRAFIILQDGKIVLENYWGQNFLRTGSFDESTNWYWASAAKTITAFLIGIAQEEGVLNINNSSSQYLGEGWTTAPKEKEDLITVQNHLTMTTGLDYAAEFNCTIPSCLTYKSDASTEWYYFNSTYLLLKQIISNATGEDYKSYTATRLASQIGMSGAWLGDDLDALYWSTARDMARFGLLMLNDGIWDGKALISDEEFMEELKSPSTQLNPSYGYLWWLNGQNSIVLPSLAASFPRPLAENAPDDLYAAMGKNGQFIDVVPSKNMVVIRMGDASDESLVPALFHDEMWEYLNRVIN